MSEFITRQGNQLMYRGSRYRSIGFNAYDILVNSSSQTNLRNLFTAAKNHGVTQFRFWCFDRDNVRRDNNGNLQGTNQPTNIQGNFRYIVPAAIGSNILVNGDFEQGLNRWTVDPNYVLSTNNPHGGINCIEQTSAGGFQNLTTANDSIGWPVTPNTTYTLKFWVNSTITGQVPLLYINTGNAFGTTIASGSVPNTGGVYAQQSIVFNSGSNTKVFLRIQNNNGTVHAFYDDFTLGVGAGKALAWVESTLQQLDLILDEARRSGIKLTLTLFDSNNYQGAAYPGKITYDNWANQIYGLNLNTGDNRTDTSTDFFKSIYPRQLLKDFVFGIANRVNTINGRLYKTDDTIMAWELGNETRYDSDHDEVGNINTPNAVSVQTMLNWIQDISGYIKSIDPNHLVIFGGGEFMPTKVFSSDGAHSFELGVDNGVAGDHVYVGSYNGIDYQQIAAKCPNVDILSFHMYPNQGLGSSDIHGYGYALGYVYSTRAQGLIAQIQAFVNDVKAVGNKAVEFGEIGYAREDTGTFPGWPMYPRILAFQNAIKIAMDAGADIIKIWSATYQGGGSFSVGMNETGTPQNNPYWGTNENSNDAQIMRMINGYNTELVFPGKRARAT